MQKRKLPKKILTKQECFEHIKEETNNNLAPELTPRGKIKSQVTYKRPILSVQNKWRRLQAIVTRLDITFLKNAREFNRRVTCRT